LTIVCWGCGERFAPDVFEEHEQKHRTGPKVAGLPVLPTRVAFAVAFGRAPTQGELAEILEGADLQTVGERVSAVELVEPEPQHEQQD
jgi:hypothetical protein